MHTAPLAVVLAALLALPVGVGAAVAADVPASRAVVEDAPRTSPVAADTPVSTAVGEATPASTAVDETASASADGIADLVVGDVVIGEDDQRLGPMRVAGVGEDVEEVVVEIDLSALEARGVDVPVARCAVPGERRATAGPPRAIGRPRADCSPGRTRADALVRSGSRWPAEQVLSGWPAGDDHGAVLDDPRRRSDPGARGTERLLLE